MSAAPVDPLGPDLTKLMRALRLPGNEKTPRPRGCRWPAPTAPAHAAFLEQILADELACRDARSAVLRARPVGLHPAVRIDTWTDPPGVTYDRELLADLATLRFLEAGSNVLVLGPVRIGKTYRATGIGHIAIRRRRTVQMARTDRMST